MIVEYKELPKAMKEKFAELEQEAERLKAQIDAQVSTQRKWILSGWIMSFSDDIDKSWTYDPDRGVLVAQGAAMAPLEANGVE